MSDHRAFHAPSEGDLFDELVETYIPSGHQPPSKDLVGDAEFISQLADEVEGLKASLSRVDVCVSTVMKQVAALQTLHLDPVDGVHNVECVDCGELQRVEGDYFVLQFEGSVRCFLCEVDADEALKGSEFAGLLADRGHPDFAARRELLGLVVRGVRAWEGRS